MTNYAFDKNSIHFEELDDDWNIDDNSTEDNSISDVRDFSQNITENVLVARKGRVRDLDSFKEEMLTMPQRLKISLGKM